jgi:hypothetical protein
MVWLPAPALPEPLSNNAVTAVLTPRGCAVVSVGGLGATRTREAISSRAYGRWLDDGAFRSLPPLPGKPRLATSAIGLRGQLYVLGGYDVATDGAETSHATLFALDVARALERGDAVWQRRADLPVAIDDAVALAYRDRFLVVISGWSNTAPVATVQIYDAERDRWQLGTEFPGTPVFGHSAAIAGDEVVVIDGVAREAQGYRITHQAFRATLDPAAPERLRWSALPQHPGAARYRAAGGAVGGSMVFHGGTADPYNYNGLSYASKQPSPPLGDDLWFEPSSGAFSIAASPAAMATMDHRALASCGDDVISIGGMRAGPTVHADSWRGRRR